MGKLEDIRAFGPGLGPAIPQGQGAEPPATARAEIPSPTPVDHSFDVSAMIAEMEFDPNIGAVVFDMLANQLAATVAAPTIVLLQGIDPAWRSMVRDLCVAIHANCSQRTIEARLAEIAAKRSGVRARRQRNILAANMPLAWGVDNALAVAEAMVQTGCTLPSKDIWWSLYPPPPAATPPPPPTVITVTISPSPT